VRKADNLPPSCAVVTKSGNLNFLELSGPLRTCNGTALHLPFTLKNTKTVATRQTGPSVTAEALRRLRLRWSNSLLNSTLDTKLQICQLQSDLDFFLKAKCSLVTKGNQSDAISSACHLSPVRPTSKWIIFLA